MSTSASRDPERAKRIAVARQYRREGYTVAMPERGDPIPSFLDGTAPGLVAVRDDDRAVVMIKRADRIAGSNELVTLAERIEAQQDWRLELITVAPFLEAELLPPDPLDVVGQLVVQGAFRAAFLLRFAEMENALAVLTAADAGRLASGATGMASGLVRSGALSSEALMEVRAAAAVRNALVHGGMIAPDQDATARLSALVAQLRREIGEMQAVSPPTAPRRSRSPP